MHHFISCITKSNNAIFDNAEDLDVAMLMYNLIEYSKNYSKTSEGLRNYSREKRKSGGVGNINCSIKDSKSFNYKISITGRLQGNNIEKQKN